MSNVTFGGGGIHESSWSIWTRSICMGFRIKDRMQKRIFWPATTSHVCTGNFREFEEISPLLRSGLRWMWKVFGDLEFLLPSDRCLPTRGFSTRFKGWTWICGWSRRLQFLLAKDVLNTIRMQAKLHKSLRNLREIKNAKYVSDAIVSRAARKPFLLKRTIDFTAFLKRYAQKGKILSTTPKSFSCIVGIEVTMRSNAWRRYWWNFLGGGWTPEGKIW